MKTSNLLVAVCSDCSTYRLFMSEWGAMAGGKIQKVGQCATPHPYTIQVVHKNASPFFSYSFIHFKKWNHKTLYFPWNLFVFKPRFLWNVTVGTYIYSHPNIQLTFSTTVNVTMRGRGIVFQVVVSSTVNNAIEKVV